MPHILNNQTILSFYIMDYSLQTNPITKTLPVLPLRDTVMYPNTIIPIFVGRNKSVEALEQAIQQYDKKLLLVAQKNPETENPQANDLYTVGTISNVLQLLKLPDGTVKALIEGEKRANIQNFITHKKHLLAQISYSETIEENTRESVALMNLTLSTFEQYIRFNKNIPVEIIASLSEIKEPGYLADAIAVHLPIKIEDKQILLQLPNGLKRLETLVVFLKNCINLLEVEKRITSRVQKQVKKNQREYYLKEQMEAIQKELNHDTEDSDELQNLAKKIETAGMSAEVRKKAESELRRLKMMHPMSPESTVSRNYLDCLINIPWKKYSSIKNDNLSKAERILDKEHYGLEKVKERIIEYLAVQHRVKKPKGPILCLVGPPGVGKTSLGHSIAHATGRKFVKTSLGGVHDEAEIRGHRRTYIGALPGKIVQNLTKAGVRNPLFLIDEIDKMTKDFHGDPSAALLEALDPEQNTAFNDHYLEIDYDLSDVMFITTANTLDIPPPLLDRMEVIHLSGYTEDEKLNIAMKYLLPKQLKLNGLKKNEIKISTSVFQDIIRYYTREAGVRNLERELSKICRKAVKEISINSSMKKVSITPDQLDHYLGVRQYHFGEIEKENQIGQVTGLAWTEVGGELLTVESTIMPGTGKTIMTGQIGEVMQESIQAATSVIKSRAYRLGVNPKSFEKYDIHVHLPEGAIPKDGPSAGITVCTALVSTITGIPVRADLAMTGEITLRGEILPIGGLKEKLLAARRGGIRHVLIPYENKKDLKEIPDNVMKDIEIHLVRWIDEVLQLALLESPKPLDESQVPMTLIAHQKKITVKKPQKKAH
jgi:ATP-dependent Lon protease